MSEQQTTVPTQLGLGQAFAPHTEQQWRELVARTLKTGSLEELSSCSLEGLTIKPIYGPADAEALPPAGLPGQPPHLRGRSAAGYLARPWIIRADLDLPGGARFAEAARQELEGGTTGLGLVLDEASRAGLDPDAATARGLVGQGGLPVSCWPDLAEALHGVDLAAVPVTLNAGCAALAGGALLCAAAQQAGVPLERLRGALSLDPLGQLSTRGTLPAALELIYDEMADLTAWCQQQAPGLGVAVVHTEQYLDAGGSAVHELGFAMATAVEYMTALTDRGVSPDVAAARLSFSFGVGSRLLNEVAKLRAARLLWSRVAGAFGCAADARAATIHARTCRWNKTLRDPHNNLLRATLEAFAAAVAGAQSISVAPHDDPAGAGDAAARRQARNIQLLLLHETALHRVADPAGGSWAMETLTHQLAERAWSLLQQVERMGGMAAALEAGFPRQQVAQLVEQRAEAIICADELLVGVNRFAADQPRPTASTVEDLQGLGHKRADTIIAYRAAREPRALEPQQRRLDEALGGEPGARMAAALEAAAAGMTLGELTAATRPEPGTGPCITPLGRLRAEAIFDACPPQTEGGA